MKICNNCGELILEGNHVCTPTRMPEIKAIPVAELVTIATLVKRVNDLEARIAGLESKTPR